MIFKRILTSKRIVRENGIFLKMGHIDAQRTSVINIKVIVAQLLDIYISCQNLNSLRINRKILFSEVFNFIIIFVLHFIGS